MTDRDVRRLTPGQRKSEILEAALKLAQGGGLRSLRRDAIATAANTASGSINYHFSGMSGLLDSVIELAVAREVLDIVAEAIIMRHTAAYNVPKALRARAMRSVS